MDTAYDEMFLAPAVARDHYRALEKTLVGLSPDELRRTQQAADLTFLHEGITFTVYGSKEGTERISRMTWCRALSPATSGHASKKA